MPFKSNTDEIEDALNHLDTAIEEARAKDVSEEENSPAPFKDASDDADKDVDAKIQRVKDTVEGLRTTARKVEEEDLSGASGLEQIDPVRSQPSLLSSTASSTGSGSPSIQQQQALLEQQRQWAQQQQQAMAVQQAQQQWQQWQQQQQWMQQQQAMAQQAAMQQPTTSTSSGGGGAVSNEDFARLLKSIDEGNATPTAASSDDLSTSTSSESGTRTTPSSGSKTSNEAAHTVIIGDSTTEQLKGALSERLDADGASYTIDSKGGRAIIEGGDGSGLAAIRARKEELGGGGEDTNWFIGLGVNDANNIAANSGVSQAERIDQVMEELSDQGLVYWPMVDISPDANTGYDLGPEVEEFNQALLEAEKRYDNLRVVDWNPSDSQYTDGIHYNQSGMDERVEFIADTIE